MGGIFLFWAFALSWLLLFGYLVTLARGLSRVERELAHRASQPADPPGSAG
jgi:CcmD family protein